MNHTNLGNKNATIAIHRNYFACCNGHLRDTRYKINKKFTCLESLIKIQQQKWRLVSKRRPDQVSNKKHD